MNLSWNSIPTRFLLHGCKSDRAQVLVSLAGFWYVADVPYHGVDEIHQSGGKS
jgi:hypothetical protein